MWTWSCVGQKSLKLKVIAEVNPKLRNSRTEIKEKTGKNTCTYIYYEMILKLFTFHNKNLLEDLSNIKIIFLYIMSSIMKNIFIDISDQKTVELVDYFLYLFAVNFKSPMVFCPYFERFEPFYFLP